MNNPFRFGEPVTGPSFANRDGEMSGIIADARDRENTVVFGERGIGKSSLLAEIARRHAREFVFATVDARAVADESRFLDSFTRSVIRAGVGRAWTVGPALLDLLSTRRMRAALAAGDGPVTGGDGQADVPDGAVAEKAGRGTSKPHEEGGPVIQMCPRCGRPLKWIEKYKRYFCYSCKEYAPTRRGRRAGRGRGSEPSGESVPCPICNVPMRFVHRYSDHYCPGCERYPMTGTRAGPEPWSAADIRAALDLPQRLAELKGKPVVVMMDDIDEVLGLGEGRVAKSMRLQFEEHDDAAYVFAGNAGEAMRQMFEDRDGAFFKFARPVELGRMPGPDMQRFLMSRFRSAGGRLSERAAERISGVSEGIPGYAQQIGHELFHISATPQEADVDAAIQNAVRRHSSACALLWDSVRSPLHRRYLCAIAREPKAPQGKEFVRRYGLRSRSHVQRIERQLEAKGIVREREILDPMFVMWIRMSETA